MAITKEHKIRRIQIQIDMLENRKPHYVFDNGKLMKTNNAIIRRKEAIKYLEDENSDNIGLTKLEKKFKFRYYNTVYNSKIGLENEDNN